MPSTLPPSAARRLAGPARAATILPPGAVLASSPGRRTLAWWQWPHVLSLDAPAVAVVWQQWWAYGAGVRLHWFHGVILALGVWMIYLADRLADTWGVPPDAAQTARHQFSARHRRLLVPLLAAVVAALTVLTAATLPGRELVGGLGLLAVAGGYFWRIHRRRRSARGTGWVPKEAFVGAIFAGGTVFSVVWQGGVPAGIFVMAAAAFAALCFCNCALITQWETGFGVGGATTRVGWGCLWLAAFAGALALAAGSAMPLPIGLAALVLAWLDSRRASFPREALRVLVDAALLTPLLGLAWHWT